MQKYYFILQNFVMFKSFNFSIIFCAVLMLFPSGIITSNLLANFCPLIFEIIYLRIALVLQFSALVTLGIMFGVSDFLFYIILKEKKDYKNLFVFPIIAVLPGLILMTFFVEKMLAS